ncbi:siderophore-interacting protein [Streptomyces sp. NPDC097619]|uniref:siderophore-interacting protein n=1 Tax=Streptomyces sp. NPDC097619 TaxID=3157228 RepID=UPI003330B7AD
MTATTETPAVAHFRFFTLTVTATRRVGRSFLRVTFGGEELRGFRSGGYDQSLSLFLPLAHQEHAELPDTGADTWFAAWRGIPDADRPVMRSYTVREQRTAEDGSVEVDIDFVLHGDSSPASHWAGRAVPGSRILAIGPAVAENKSVRFRPPAGLTELVLYADETALPAAAAILERLPREVRVTAYLQVPHAEDRIPLTTPDHTETVWLVHGEGGAGRAEQVLDALRSTEAGEPGEGAYAWIAGEAGTVRAVRRHLVQERHIDRRAVRFTGYWRLGASEEQLLAEAYAGRAPSEDPDSAL